jgi:hypothetical protein
MLQQGTSMANGRYDTHLQRRKLDESSNGLDICFPASLHLLTTSTETRQIEV